MNSTPKILFKETPAYSVLQTYKRYGVTKRQVHSLLINLFHYPAEYRDTLQDYFILCWTGEHLFDRLIDGTVSVGSTEYLIIYQNCNSYTSKRAKQVRLSFRKPMPEFNLPAYVIVRTIGE